MAATKATGVEVELMTGPRGIQGVPGRPVATPPERGATTGHGGLLLAILDVFLRLIDQVFADGLLPLVEDVFGGINEGLVLLGGERGDRDPLSFNFLE